MRITGKYFTTSLLLNRVNRGSAVKRLKPIAFAIGFAFQAPMSMADQMMNLVEISTANQESVRQESIVIPDKKPLKPLYQPRIQIAILLDTSGSMDGLINQTRNQLWQVVNEFSGAKQNGLTPILEVALFEYGNSGNARESGYVRQLTGFTRELDSVSAGLFSLTTNGGDEYCGYAIDTAVKSLQWSQSKKDIKTIFIAGNEPFTQGPVDFRQAIAAASRAGISVNTIHAGQHQAGIDGSWQQAALLAGGDFMSINANQRIVHVDTPQDKRIAELNAQLNQTYIPYGAQGKQKVKRQIKQDQESARISAGLLAKRARSKSSSYYNNASWDMVDALEDGQLAEEDVAVMPVSELPVEMQKMSAEERKDYVAKKQKARLSIKEAIAKLSEQREQHIAQTRKAQALSAPSMSDALITSVRKEASKKSFELVKTAKEKAAN